MSDLRSVKVARSRKLATVVSPSGGSMFRVIHFRKEAADRAFGEHRALARVEALYPHLREDPEFQFARQAAFRRFERAFEVA